MPWKLHNIPDKDVYKNLRYDRIRFLEETKRKGEPALTLYPDPAGYVDIGIGFKIDSMNSGDTVLNSFHFGCGGGLSFQNIPPEGLPKCLRPRSVPEKELGGRY